MLSCLRRCLLTLLSVIVSLAQTYLGTVRGTVSDPTGAVIPNAAIILREPATGVEVRRLTTDGQGNYELSDLKPATYRLTCEAAGFKPSSVDQIIVETGQVRRIDVTMAVGAVTQEAVTVTA